MDVLVLGGTAFVGRAVAQAALGAGHRVTCLARGSAPPPEGVEFVVGDRDAEDGLSALVGRRFDVVVDVSRQPGQVRRAVRDLVTEHWVFVSTANVYARQDDPERDESTELLEPTTLEVAPPEEYGAAKVACEDLVRAAPGTATVVRPGLIGGPGDQSGRTGYYVWRFAHPTAADVLVPEDPDFSCAIIDVRDLATWIVHSAERRLDGAFNVTGEPVRLADHLALARSVAGADRIRIRTVPTAVLADAGVGEWMGPRSLPLWVADPEWRHFATMGTAAARSAGLVTRPLVLTLLDTLAWEERRSTPRSAGLSDQYEVELRARLDG
jgi:2'-hydroxyisoflavone reductase